MEEGITTIRLSRALLAVAALASLAGCVGSPSAAPGEAPSVGAAERGILQSFEAFNRAYHVRSGCYTTVGNQQFRFKVYEGVPYDKAHWDLLARTVTRSCTDTATMPRRAPYYSIRRPHGEQVVMVLWKNITSGEHGYMVIWAGSIGSYVTTNGGRTRPLTDHPTVTWRSGGETITISARNPEVSSPNLLEYQFPLLLSFSLTGTR